MTRDSVGKTMADGGPAGYVALTPTLAACLRG